MIDESRIEKVLQYVEKIIEEEKKKKECLRVMGNALAAAYASNYEE